ncbi:MAG: hypothetical protein LBR70_06685 [Lactobacillaceae bacterium]|jgi:hypothetical protein|nr:hypothetical protein [Lactobacillaceae bacterium]
MKHIDLLGEYEWLADFQIPGVEDKISGIVKYNKDDGLKIELLVPENIYNPHRQEDKMKFDVLYGANNDLGLFTLINVKELGYSSNWVYTSCKCSAEILIIGGAFDSKDAIFDKMTFNTNDLESFCTHNNHLIEIDYKPLLSAKMGGADFRIGKAWSSSCSHRNRIYFSGDKADELKKELAELEKRYAEQKTYIGSKDKVELYFIYEKQGSYRDYFSFLYDINSLLSILMLRPIYTLQVSFYHKDGIKTHDGLHSIDKEYQVLFTPYIRNKKYDLEKNNYHSLLFHLEDFSNFDDIFCNFSKLNDDKNIILQVLRKNIYRDNVANVYERYIMLVTALEAAYYQFGKKFKTEACYDEVINLYAGDRIISDIMRYLDCDNNAIGKILSSIRNYIVHYNNKDKKAKKIIASIDFYNLCESLYMVLAIATCEFLGFEGRLLGLLQYNYDKIGHGWSRD